jgi:fatty acid desaturase
VLANGCAWALPFGIMIANFRDLAEHTQLWHQDLLDSLHSTARWSVTDSSPFFNNQNHHLEYHLFRGLPRNALGQAHRLLERRRRKYTLGSSRALGPPWAPPQPAGAHYSALQERGEATQPRQGGRGGG